MSESTQRNNLSRRKGFFSAAVLGGLLVGSLPVEALAFGFDDVARRAEELAQQGYRPPETSLPDELRELSYAEYAQIQFKRDRDVWSGNDAPFTLSFIHEGMHYDSSIQLNSIDSEGEVHGFAYNPDDFTYGDLGISDDVKHSDGVGIAGVRINHTLNGADSNEVMVFLGASYFRAVGRGQVYGLSGRGLAVDTGLSSGEEFPRFSEMWIVEPSPESLYLTIFALLDSPSVTGAYRFVLRPGEGTLVDVQSRLYLRRPVEKLGIAPLTSMYLYGPEQPSSTQHYMPAIHDSNGLLIDDAQNGWLWRPLANPARLMMNRHTTPQLRGYGLMQRGHSFSDYQDIDARYDLRPSAWVEPLNEWGAGSVELIQIPTDNETNDNIVSMWLADEPHEPGTPLAFDYRIIFTTNESRHLDPQLAWVEETRRSRGEVIRDDLVREPDGTLAFVLDFVGPSLEGIGNGANISVDASVGDNGELAASRVVHNPATNGWRVFVNVKRNNGNQPLDIRAKLMLDGKQVSETWYYRLPANG
ncbi:glucan biosynthesis protein G [Halomonas sp. ISL-60]|nr:glucan biosynthesis protein G [Halomonas sp. ISL-60]